MGDIIKNELNWKEDNSKEYTKHFDCIAEPFTNYVRNKIYGYERRLCQYSNMIRRNEINREKALKLYESDNINEKPDNYKEILELLNLKEQDIDTILSNYSLKYEKYTSKADKLYVSIMKLIKNVKQTKC